MPELWVQKWEESERGWGNRPDGYSLHLTPEDLAAFAKEYWATMPDEAPDEYSRRSGTPYLAPVTQALYDQVAATKNGKRFWGTAPWPGGQDGWVPQKPPRLDEDAP